MMNRITDKDMLQCLQLQQVEALAKSLGAEVTYISTSDHTGKQTKKIVFEYVDE